MSSTKMKYVGFHLFWSGGLWYCVFEDPDILWFGRACNLFVAGCACFCSQLFCCWMLTVFSVCTCMKLLQVHNCRSAFTKSIT